MQQPHIPDIPFVKSVLHPTDFTLPSQNAFAHALAITLLIKSRFTILHVSNSKDEWTQFPAVRSTLEQWGLLEKGSPRSAVFEKLSVEVMKVAMRSNNPLKAILHYSQDHQADLIVLATQGREGLQRWIHPSMAERIAEKSKAMTLFVHGTESGFVSQRDGTLCLQRILVPVDFHPNPLPAIEYAARAARLMNNSVEVILFHVGDSSETPPVEIPEIPSCSWRKVHKQGNVVEEITKAARDYAVNLIIMPTAGNEGFLDALRGSVTAQVLRRVSSPVLAVPAI
jgi:nucleotide-binding universal stress UspA family protein